MPVVDITRLWHYAVAVDDEVETQKRPKRQREPAEPHQKALEKQAVSQYAIVANLHLPEKVAG